MWEVTIGFNVETEKNALNLKQFKFLKVGDNSDSVREFRVVRLKADDGEFVELDNK